MMTLSQAMHWIPGAKLHGDGQTLLNRVHTDTRTLQAGDFFVAIAGERYDANDFLISAKAKGASAVLCTSLEKLMQSGLPGLVVADARKALGTLALGWRAQFNLPMIAVTGSNGKTTVTQMIASILRAYKPHSMLSTQGNFNNDIGVPLTLLRLDSSHQIAVIEIGMNHPGEIALLADMVKPTIALVNNAQREHLEFMATLDAVARENAAVISSLSADGIAVFPCEDKFTPLWQSIAGQRETLTFNRTNIDVPFDGNQAEQYPRANVRCSNASWHAGAWHLQVSTPVGDLRFVLRIAGAHNVHNALAALACSVAAGVPLEVAASGLEAFVPVKGRSRTMQGLVGGRAYTLIDDTYNANPDSVRAAIEVLASLPGPRLMVLGDMGEVGDQGAEFHAEAGEYAKSLGIERLFTLGHLSGKASTQFGTGRHFTEIDSLNSAVVEAMPSCSSVLVKGSRFMKMERVLEAIEALTDPTFTSRTVAVSSAKEAQCS